MKKFEDFVEGIREEVQIPDTVNRRFEETLSKLDGKEGKQGKKWLKIASVAASFVLVSTIVLASNQALASKFSLLGNIFGRVEDKVTYSGDYNNKQKLLEKENSNAILSVEDKGIKISASEVYSDGFSVFVTLKMDYAKYDFSKLTTYPANNGKSVTLITSFGINRAADDYDYDIQFEGENEGKHTFVGMTKFDKTDYSLEKGYVNINIKGIWLENWDKEIKGSWILRVPYETDKENGKEIIVNKKTKNNLIVEKLFLSPYQLVVLSDVPYTKPYENKTDQEIIDKWGGKIKKGDSEEIKKIRDSKEYDFYEIAVFTQDGKRLDWEEIGDGEGSIQRDLYSLRGKDVSKVHIYVTQKKENMFELITAKTVEEARAKSEYDFVVDIK